MRTRFICLSLTLAAGLLLSACTSPTSAANLSPTAEDATTTETSATPAPTVTPEPGLPYDEIRTVEELDAIPSTPGEGYFTMSRNGLWGLMRADGTEVLPCQSTAPVSRCGAEGHWIWSPEQPMDWEAFDALSAELTQAGDGALCPGHGGLSDMFFYDLDSPGRDIHALDPSALRWYQVGTPGEVREMDDTLWDTYGDLLPVFSAHEEGEEGDPKFPGDPVDDEGVLYWYFCKDGSGLNITDVVQAGWFFDENLAPVQIGDAWTYIDRTGHEKTERIYSATWGAQGEYDNPEDPTAPKYAACLQNGYAAVCRDGHWGLLDATGTEVIPCEHPGVAWEGTTLWVKSEDGWHQAELPKPAVQREQVTIERDRTATLYDGSPIPQQSQPLYYVGSWQGKTWEEVAEQTGFSAQELRALNPGVTEDAQGKLQSAGIDLLLSEAWPIPQTEVCRVTVTMPGMPQPYDSRSYQLPDALPEDAARALALCYYQMESNGQGFTTEALPDNPDYVKVTSGVRYDTFSQLKSWLESVYTSEAVSAMLDGQGTDPYYKEGPGDTLWMQGYAFDHIIPQSGLTCTEPEQQPDGSLRFAAVCLCITDDEDIPLDEGQGRLYYAPVQLVPTADGWRVAEAKAPF